MSKTSLTIGACIVAGAIAFNFVAGTEARAQAAVAAAQPQNGRYVIVHSPHVRADTVMIDTATGRVWSLTSYTFLNGEPRAWTLMNQVNNNADREALIQKYGEKPEPTKPGSN